MTPEELRPLLKIARRRPVTCAVATTKDRQGVVLLDKKLKPRKLAAVLKQKARAGGVELDPATIRFGRTSVDGASDAAKVTFTVHKAAPGAMKMALLPNLRPAGFQRCEFVVNEALETEPEDGEDHHPEDDGEDGDAAPGGVAEVGGAARP